MRSRTWTDFIQAGTLAGAAGLALLTACGGGGSGAGAGTGGTGAVNVLVTDAPTDAWSEIGVIIRKVVLIPQGRNLLSGVTIFDGTRETQPLNLVQLDDLSELLGKADIPAGTYDRMVVTVDGNPSSITLVPAPDALNPAPTAIPFSQIRVRGVKNAQGWAALPVVTLDQPLVVVAGQSTAVQTDFDLSHPLFITSYTSNTGTPIYALNLKIHHKPVGALRQVYLRRNRGQVASVTQDGTALVLHTVHGADLTLLADATNKTLFYNLDALPMSVNASFTFPGDLTAGKYVRATARFQGDGSLWAVRVWYSSDASKLPTWMPEGHVLSVNTGTHTLRVLNEKGVPVSVSVDSGTQFFFQGGTTPIGSGTAFLAALGRDFKVNVTVADPLAVPLVATAIDIERGVFEGNITGADGSGFTYHKWFSDGYEDHTVGYDAAFHWWNFTFPALVSTDQTAFLTKALPGGSLKARAASGLNWVNDGWAAKGTVFLPCQLSTAPQTVSAAFSGGNMTVTFTPDDGGGPTTAVVNLNTTPGSQPIVTEFTKGTNDITETTLTVADWGTKLSHGAVVRVHGIPKGDGTLDAYYVCIFD
jgi:hypothetical protein